MEVSTNLERIYDAVNKMFSPTKDIPINVWLEVGISQFASLDFDNLDDWHSRTELERGFGRDLITFSKSPELSITISKRDASKNLSEKLLTKRIDALIEERAELLRLLED